MMPSDSLVAWSIHYQQVAVVGIRSSAVAQKIALHLDRFCAFFADRYGHDRISICVQRDVQAWLVSLQAQEFAPATINNHLASLSTFATWVATQSPDLFPLGNPTRGIGELSTGPLEPRALSTAQVQSLKNLCDRLPRLHQMKGPRWYTRRAAPPIHAHSRPWRDRAIVFVLLSTGLRRSELVQLDLVQVEPHDPVVLRVARRARIRRVRGKGNSERDVFLSHDARIALADYLERERTGDTNSTTTALFLSAASVAARAPDGRLSCRSINFILEHIGQWHDADMRDSQRHISPLRPHDLRHTFAFLLAKATGADAYELERRLGHRSQRYIQRYTNPPEEVAAAYVEGL